MLNLSGHIPKRWSMSEAIHTSVNRYLDAAFGGELPFAAALDRWSAERLRAESLAKVDLVLEAADPVEQCHRDLIREIDAEAENGIYLVGTEFADTTLRELAADPGISGRLHRESAAVAGSLAADDLGPASSDAGPLWTMIRVRYARARLEVSVSEILMRYLLDNAAATTSMVTALRAMLYAYHEDNIRHLCALPPLLDQRQSRDLVIMVAELEKQGGNANDRVREIRERAGTACSPNDPPNA